MFVAIEESLNENVIYTDFDLSFLIKKSELIGFNASLIAWMIYFLTN